MLALLWHDAVFRPVPKNLLQHPPVNVGGGGYVIPSRSNTVGVISMFPARRSSLGQLAGAEQRKPDEKRTSVQKSLLMSRFCCNTLIELHVEQ